MDYSRDLFVLCWWPLLFILEWWGYFPSMGCMVPQPFAARGNRSYPEFWVMIGELRYSGYFTTIVSHKPSVEWVARAGHLTEGRKGSHMVPWVLSQDSVVRLRG
jgi:hypothetical protein